MTVQALTEKPSDVRKLYFRVLGRTLEHFGVQMYKRRAIAIAELVANCWDAGAEHVTIVIPQEKDYNPATSEIEIGDDGRGMSFGEIQERYLVLGQNRRRLDGREVGGRPLMGRKGIGKLAGFGLASCMKVLTWQGAESHEFELDRENLKASDNTVAEIPIPWKPSPKPVGAGLSGTIVKLSSLKHKTPLGIEELRLSLARRFARRIQGEMVIMVNGATLPNPVPPLMHRVPAEGSLVNDLAEGQQVKYWYGFAEDVIKEKEQRGFAIMVSGKVAQAPPFFFDVEATASGQHSTKYVVGEIDADFLDSGVDDETDIIATDRQEIDWEDERVRPFRSWGEALARKALAECRDFRGTHLENWVFSQAEFMDRIGRLDTASQKQVRGFVRVLGTVLEESDRSRDLVSSLIRAYEFRYFHDVIDELEQASQDATALAALLGKLHDWQILEGRAILEVIKGRLAIIDKFEKMLVTNAPETAPAIGADNMHDLLAGQPWLLNPDWQVFREEVSVTKLMREWGSEEKEGDRTRLDFLALKSDRRLVIIEIKRPDHPTDIEELTRLMKYREKLVPAYGEDIYMVMLCGREFKVSGSERDNWRAGSRDREVRFWSGLFDRSKTTYEHYRALLEANANHPDFTKALDEVRETRRIIDGGTVYRGEEARKAGLGGQDVDYTKDKSQTDDGQPHTKTT